MIGVRAHDFGKHTIEELPKILKESGYEAAQLALPRAFVGIDSYEDIRLSHLDKIRQTFEENQIKIAVFSCYQDISNPDEEIRSKAVECIKKCLMYSVEVGASCVGTETSWPALTRKEKSIRYPYMLDSMRRIIEEAQRIDAVLAVEPVHRHPLEDMAAVMDLVDRIADPKHLKIIFDPSNVLDTTKAIEQKTYWMEWLSAIAPYVDIFHIKDFVPDEAGGYRLTPLGEGVMEYDVIAKWIQEQQRELCLIRDEAEPKWTSRDIAYMKEKFFQKQ